MYSQQDQVNKDVRLAVKIGIIIFAVAAAYCVFTAGHIHLYVLQAKPASALADPPRVGKLLWLEGLLAVTGLCFLALMLIPTTRIRQGEGQDERYKYGRIGWQYRWFRRFWVSWPTF